MPRLVAKVRVPMKVRGALTVERKAVFNVVGRIAASAKDTVAGAVLVGAHYDHLGHGETGAMQRKGEEGKIHPGADDNASGTAAVLQLATSIMTG